MRYSTGLVLAALSIGEVLASPTPGHAHLHKHAKKDVNWSTLNWDAMGIDWTSAWAAGQKTSTIVAPTSATATPTTEAAVFIEAVKTSATTSAAAKATTSAASSGSSSTVDSEWASIVGAANDKTEFGATTPPQNDPTSIYYIPNIGDIEGSNMIKVSSTSGYDFSNTFINTSGNRMTIVLWNQAASPGLIGYKAAVPNLGACQASKYAALTFSLAPGASQIVAFANNTIIGWAEATTSLNAASQFKTSWGEGKFVSTGSGYDLTCIPNAGQNTYTMSIKSAEVACISDNTQNYWLTDTQPIGNSDGSCYVPSSTMHLTTKMGGAM